MPCLCTTWGNGGQAMPQIGDHAFLMITPVRYDFLLNIKERQLPKRDDDEIPCLSSSAERDFVGANLFPVTAGRLC